MGKESVSKANKVNPATKEKFKMATAATDYISFLEERIATLELENEQRANKKAMHIFSWGMTIPTPQKHHMTGTRNGKRRYLTSSNCDGNLKMGTVKTRPMMELDHGNLMVVLCTERGMPECHISFNFYLKTVKRGRVNLRFSLCYKGKVIFSKERKENLEVTENDGYCERPIQEILPSRLPSPVYLVIEIIEWELYKN